jgi:hypothetical protein
LPLFRFANRDEIEAPPESEELPDRFRPCPLIVKGGFRGFIFCS